MPSCRLPSVLNPCSSVTENDQACCRADRVEWRFARKKTKVKRINTSQTFHARLNALLTALIFYRELKNSKKLLMALRALQGSCLITADVWDQLRTLITSKTGDSDN